MERGSGIDPPGIESLEPDGRAEVERLEEMQNYVAVGEQRLSPSAGILSPERKVVNRESLGKRLW